MFIESYFQTATHLFEQYQVQLPLHLFLKEYFKNNKKFGSRDRKYIAELLYGIYRLGNINSHLQLRDRFLYGSLLSGRLPKLFYEKTNKELAELYESPFEEKKDFLIRKYNCQFDIPFSITAGLSQDQFIKNLFAKPKVFIRIRQHKKQIEEILFQQKVHYHKVSESCFSFDAQIKLDEYLEEEDYVIQDYASQLSGLQFMPKAHETWWDCCAGSGGKSIMLLDQCASIDLFVSDIRESILKNLHSRMQVYGYDNKYLSQKIDLSESNSINKKFDKIICDIPCSGSGTWSRSPEQFYFFTEQKLNDFTNMQASILSNVITSLKPGGTLFYITCSVFKNENEVVLNQVLTSNPIQLMKKEIINCSLQDGDCMFMATLKSNL